MHVSLAAEPTLVCEIGDPPETHRDIATSPVANFKSVVAGSKLGPAFNSAV